MKNTGVLQTVLILGIEPQSLLNFRKDLILEIGKAGHKVIVSSMQPNAEQIVALTALGATVRPVRFSRAGMNPLRDLVTLKSLVKLFRDTKPDAVIAYTAKPVIYGALAARLCGIKNFVAMITGLGYSFVDGPERSRKVARVVVKTLYKLALPSTKVVIFQNPDDRETFKGLKVIGPNQKTGLVNGSGVDITHFKVETLPSSPVFLMIARLLLDKGVREYAEAARRLKLDFPAVRVLLVGDVDQSPNSVSQDEVQTWRVDGIECMGFLQDVRPAIAEASVVVLPSYREGTPRSVLEGMAMGRAIITTDVPGCRETVVEGENGLLVAPRNADMLYEAMKSLVMSHNKVPEMGARSRQLALDKFEGKMVAKSVMQLAGL
jgi:glycosyltransferase involved in cell wall biosynthesis